MEEFHNATTQHWTYWIYKMVLCMVLVWIRVYWKFTENFIWFRDAFFSLVKCSALHWQWKVEDTELIGYRCLIMTYSTAFNVCKSNLQNENWKRSLAPNALLWKSSTSIFGFCFFFLINYKYVFDFLIFFKIHMGNSHKVLKHETI